MMDRITYTILDGKMENHGVKPEHIKEAVERLAAYEDTGLTPEEVKLMARREEWEPMVQITRIHGVPLNRLERLAQAEAEGRLIVLPVKVGDTVYQTDGIRIYESTVRNIVFDTNTIAFDERALGKTVFTSREAAEAALKEVRTVPYDKDWLDSMGLCHKCGSRKKFERFQYCEICIEKIRQDNEKYHPTEWYAERKEAINTRRRELYQEKKAHGICVRCAEKATHGLYCLDHAIKAKRRSATRAQRAKNMRHDRGLITQKRAENGLCLWCGQPAAKGTNACEYHRKVFSDAGKKGGGNEWNEQFFKLIFPDSKRT